MAADPKPICEPGAPSSNQELEVPRTTIAPLTVALGLAMIAAGVITSLAFVMVGISIVVAGVGLWISNLLPGSGHVHIVLVTRASKPLVGAVKASAVEHLHAGMPGYRLRLPAEVHPISAGIVGGILGG